MAADRRIPDERYGVPPTVVSHRTTLDSRTGSWKYIRPLYRDRVAPCNEGCPVGIDIEGYMNLLREGRVDEALELLVRENPMPAVTGRVCYHPCENACNRRQLDEPVSIHAVERALGDRALEATAPEPLPRTRDEKVAVIGSGPAGIACAYHLVRQGYAVTIFEAASEPGGILRLGIPRYRLPREILDGEIDRVTALGVEIRCGVRLGEDLPWSALDEFDAVFVATGAHRSRALGIDGEDTPGIRPGLAFLREVNAGLRPDIGKRVVIVGGGNTAMDCARTALRLGSEPIILYRRTRAEMPATEEEIEETEREGIEFRVLAAPVGVRTEDGRLVGIECIRMKLGDADASGRRRPVPVEGSEFFLETDTVLTAIGEETDEAAAPEGLSWTWGAVEVDDLGATGRKGVFAGGDLVDQPRTVADALGAGKRAALGIDRYLRGDAETEATGDIEALRLGPHGNVSATRWRGDDPVPRVNPANEVATYEMLNTAHFPPAPRHPDAHRQVFEDHDTFAEINRGLESDVALDEARRCFNCGVCNECEVCLVFCPDLAIHRRDDGKGFLIDYDYCKGCGLCNAECPRGAMAMTREGL